MVGLDALAVRAAVKKNNASRLGGARTAAITAPGKMGSVHYLRDTMADGAGNQRYLCKIEVRQRTTNTNTKAAARASRSFLLIQWVALLFPTELPDRRIFLRRYSRGRRNGGSRACRRANRQDVPDG